MRKSIDEIKVHNRKEMHSNKKKTSNIYSVSKVILQFYIWG